MSNTFSYHASTRDGRPRGLTSGGIEDTRWTLALERRIPSLFLIGLAEPYLHGRLVHFERTVFHVHLIGQLHAPFELCGGIFSLVVFKELGIAGTKSYLSRAFGELHESAGGIDVFDINVPS